MGTRDTETFDVLGVKKITHKVVLLSDNLSEGNAEAVIEMAIARGLIDDEGQFQFITKAKHGQYKEGEQYGN